MIDNHIPVNYSNRTRRYVDRLIARAIGACGVSVLLVMMLLFVWLLWVVMPLFATPSMQAGPLQPALSARPAVALGVNQGWGWRIDSQGEGRFFPLNGASPEPTLQLARGPLISAATADNSSLLLLQPDGNFQLVQPDFSAADAMPRWKFPLGDGAFDGGSGGFTLAALASSGDKRWLAALSDGQHIRLLRLQAGRPMQSDMLASGPVSQLLLSPNGTLLFASSDRSLRVWQINGQRVTLRDTIPLTHPPRQIALLSGGRSLLLADETGISQWFDIADEQGVHLHRIRDFNGARAQQALITEPQRRVFATLSGSGELRMFASKREGAFFSHALGEGVRQAQFAPLGDGLLIERADGWQYWRIDNPWPDISLRSLWQKVWYENYPQPDWVWQSTAVDDPYQAKFSLVPMVAGTLKAAALAMLFATPLALAAAIYTAWFMSPTLRRWIKPAMEMMGALPSVVVGLFASLWLAPQIAVRLSGVLLLPVALAATLLLCGPLLKRLPSRWRQRLDAPGREVWLLVPLLLLVSALCLWLTPLSDAALWGKPLAERLPGGYEQRNLLIAALAMGFALVPLIFTLAEDAIFSVPAALGQGSLALGATAWQTLSRVILPSAASGIFAALMIGFGRAVGETMIVLMATGNTPVTEGGLFHGVRALSANIAVEMPEAAAGSAHYRILFLSALVLLVFTLVLNTLAEVVRQSLRRRYGQHERQG
ncbi:phosphate ABC transporter permease [Mixta theicola]|uniref:Phosphate ABC transporter permease n=1 Tax=Mixta theicola TaxID=1458355 RepID=A0A2K1Q8I7_9GAMM|nr:ABC transporter permease subunit [Mixta theicola]PNS11351.1 phosphate ABC transporter permease [Mixta theicola]GLR10494.1 phosphate transporter permease [Mixta theicola]